MPIFITQGRFTREYVRGGLAKPEDRHAAISKLCEQAGGRMVSLHFTHRGHHDHPGLHHGGGERHVRQRGQDREILQTHGRIVKMGSLSRR